MTVYCFYCTGGKDEFTNLAESPVLHNTAVRLDFLKTSMLDLMFRGRDVQRLDGLEVLNRGLILTKDSLLSLLLPRFARGQILDGGEKRGRYRDEMDVFSQSEQNH